MDCKQCGQENHPPVLNLIKPRVAVTADIPEPAYEPTPTRWACWACGRYHNADGSLYEAP